MCSIHYQILPLQTTLQSCIKFFKLSSTGTWNKLQTFLWLKQLHGICLLHKFWKMVLPYNVLLLWSSHIALLLVSWMHEAHFYFQFFPWNIILLYLPMNNSNLGNVFYPLRQTTYWGHSFILSHHPNLLSI